MPDYSKESVYASDVKKLITWYNTLMKYNVDLEEEEGQDEEPGEEEIKDAEETKTEAATETELKKGRKSKLENKGHSDTRERALSISWSSCWAFLGSFSFLIVFGAILGIGLFEFYRMVEKDTSRDQQDIQYRVGYIDLFIGVPFYRGDFNIRSAYPDSSLLAHSYSIRPIY